MVPEIARRRLYVEDQVDLDVLMARVRSRFLWIVAGTLLSSVIGITVALVLPERYVAETVTVEVGASQNASLPAGIPGLQNLAGLAGVDSILGKGDVDLYLAIGRSREFIYKFLEDVKALPVLFADKWDDARGDWSVPEAERPTLWLAHKYFVENVYSVRQDPDSGVITFRMELADPILAADWSNRFVKALNARILRERKAEAEAKIAYLSEQLEKQIPSDRKRTFFILIEEVEREILLLQVKEEVALKIVDPAIPPELRSTPKRKIIVILFGAVGVIVSTGLTVLPILGIARARAGEKK